MPAGLRLAYSTFHTEMYRSASVFTNSIFSLASANHSPCKEITGAYNGMYGDGTAPVLRATVGIGGEVAAARAVQTCADFGPTLGAYGRNMKFDRHFG